MIAFGLARHISNDALFIAVSMLARFVEGFAECVVVCCVLMMTSLYFGGKSSYQVAFMMGY